MHDGTVTASNTMAVQVLSAKGGMWFSSDWNGLRTLEKAIAAGLITIK